MAWELSGSDGWAYWPNEVHAWTNQVSSGVSFRNFSFLFKAQPTEMWYAGHLHTLTWVTQPATSSFLRSFSFFSVIFTRPESIMRPRARRCNFHLHAFTSTICTKTNPQNEWLDFRKTRWMALSRRPDFLKQSYWMDSKHAQSLHSDRMRFQPAEWEMKLFTFTSRGTFRSVIKLIIHRLYVWLFSFIR